MRSRWTGPPRTSVNAVPMATAEMEGGAWMADCSTVNSRSWFRENSLSPAKSR